ncbi:phosphatase PAP2 family protein [Chitinophaga pinensis]|uniref:Phosphoesterase PA-phosphatase related n=1 Tax=Chitinophaga pinensis (strain ATCC 43595 / DSM 2588 / LMG 13176 / NBRC 15968 / NCIMB 11800 / UQM 2034) TaxID=485918 RepID=A0A979G9H6_CHIPD|nr:phosphatase PAP2 family protein [Chitinophaga pinensis]ACU63196.1 phosphoesterase PA-phosphatase related [Chitinophaga pinensis DSM 2588]
MKQFYTTVLLLTTAYSPILAQSRLQTFDDRTLEYLAARRTPGQTKTWLLISNTNDYVNVAIPAGLLVAGIIDHNPDMRQNALYVASSTATTFLLNTLIKKLVKRPRPFISNTHLTAVYQPKSTSFPSGHTSSAFSSATALARAYPKWYVLAPAFLWSGAVGYSRMYLGVHYPTDVTAGALLGVGTAFGMGFIRP